MRKNSSYLVKSSKQGGFAFVGIIIFILIIVLAIGYAMMSAGKTDNSGTADRKAKLNATTVTQMAGALDMGIQNIIADTNLSLDTVTLDTDAATGIYAPGPGHVIRAVNISSEVLGPAAVGAGWQTVVSEMPGIGGAGADFVFVLNGVATSVCGKINEQAIGSSAIPTVAATLSADADHSAEAALDGISSGCAATAAEALAGEAVYFQVWKPN